MMITMISDKTDNTNDVNGIVVSDDEASSGRDTTLQYVPGRHRETGCDSLSLSSNKTKLHETTSTDRSFSYNIKNKNKTNVNFVNINISTLNIRTLTCDIKFSNTIQEAQNLKLDVLALQEVRRVGTGSIDLDSGSLKGWQFIWSGFKRKAEAGVAFVLAPHVKLIDTHVHLEARILSVRVIIHGLCLSLTCAYSPTEEATDSAKSIFYRELRKASSDMLKYNRFKSVNLGDFNATIGMDSKDSGAWDDILGSNNSARVNTNTNGELFLKFCSEKKLNIINSIFRTKRNHRGTWVHKPTGLVKRLDYITARKYISRLITSCRAYRNTASIFDTDHYMVSMRLRYPSTHKKISLPMSKPRRPKVLLDISSLRQDDKIAKAYSDHLDFGLNTDRIPTDIDSLSERIGDVIRDSLDKVCPKVAPVKSRHPWEDSELQSMMSELRKSPKDNNLRKKVRIKRKSLKDQYYHEKAIAINNAAEARQVEKEFSLAKSHSMHKSGTKITISKDKLTKHFKDHFSERHLVIPPEVEHPENFDYLKDLPVEVNEAPPEYDEIEEVVKTFKNNKLGTDKIYPEGLKYHSSKNLFVYLTMLTSLIWLHLSVPKSWLALTIICLYKKGLKSLATNYRALSIGSNLSKIVPRIILNRLQSTYEQNISETQFGFRKGRSTCDAIFIIKNVIKKHAGPLVLVFIDLTAAYDHIPRDFLFRVMEFRTGAKVLIYILRKLYDGTTAIITGSKVQFDLLIGCRQGGLESPTLFNYYFDFVLKVCAQEIDKKFPDGWGLSFNYRIPSECTNREQRSERRMHGLEIIRWLLYADDLVLFCPDITQAQQIITIMNNVCKRFGLTISFSKTKVMQFNTNTEEVNVIVDNIKLDNVNEFCYLGHTIFNNDNDFTGMRIARATAKFNELGNVLRDREIHLSIRRKLLEACVRPRLTYATQSWRPSEQQIKKLESCWFGFLRRMVKGGFRRKPNEIENETNFSFVYTNLDLQNIVKTKPLRDFMNVQYLRYISHVCRRSNNNLTKLSLFFIPSKSHVRDPWLLISNLLGGISIEQAKRETQSRPGFNRLLKACIDY